MLIAFIQSVIGPFDKDFCPFHQGSGQETGKGADEDFLEEGGVHSLFESSGGASGSTLYQVQR